MKRAYIFDLDGTLLNSQKEISLRNKNALEKLYMQGNTIIFATARPPRYADPLIDQLKVKAHRIYYNGALWRTLSGKQDSHAIPAAKVQEIVAFLHYSAPQAVYSVEYHDHWITSCPFDYRGFFNIAEEPEFIPEGEITKRDCNKILIINHPNPGEVEKAFSDCCNIHVTDGGTLIQMADRRASKGLAIAEICAQQGIDLEQTVCFGDDYNDMEMFRTCGTSVAMGNGEADLKEMADHETASNDDDGVALFLEQWNG